MHRTAAALVIGNEVLSGKVDEKNVSVLARELFSLGIALRRVIVCPDEIEVIARDVSTLRANHDYVFTSGGIGPTHDDITVDAVAVAFGVSLERDPMLETAIRRYFGDATTEHHLRMANRPAGGEFIGGDENARSAPVLRIQNVFVLPGVPRLFREKLAVLRPVLDRGDRFHTHTLFLRGDEGTIAADLEEVARAHPHVLVGSYLGPQGADYDVRLTFDARVEADARAAADAMEPRLPEGSFLRREAI